MNPITKTIALAALASVVSFQAQANPVCQDQVRAEVNRVAAADLGPSCELSETRVTASAFRLLALVKCAGDSLSVYGYDVNLGVFPATGTGRLVCSVRVTPARAPREALR